MSLPISAFIIAKNEQINIGKAIKSLQGLVDDLWVIDSGSTDETVSIATKLGAKVVYNEWAGYNNQKIFGQNLCKHKWILNLDADEELSPDLINEIKFIFESKKQDNYRGYSLNFVIIHRSQDFFKKFAPSNRFIRLYNKEFIYFSPEKSSTHDEVVCSSEISFKNDIYLLHHLAYHRSATSIEQLVAKANFYSSEQAEDLFLKKKCPSRIRIIAEFCIVFFKAFFKRRYFVFGFSGAVDSFIFAFARFLRLAKAREKFLMEEKKSSRTNSR